MAVPSKKMSRSRIGMRRSGHKLQTVTWIEDKKSGELRRPHHVDLKTGMYQGPPGPRAQERNSERLHCLSVTVEQGPARLPAHFR